ncbi:hypothetical protein Cadr_000024309 [Camelus dromedarius]|uniref:Uncharacterized protein n=1 Tax=Camelus dromedarius TaxID=9838 RepID=A0A5N4CQR6_CAMDR|nr:hypothetical protein Cadr_000024309 [Camelus dromedarius]
MFLQVYLLKSHTSGYLQGEGGAGGEDRVEVQGRALDAAVDQHPCIPWGLVRCAASQATQTC